MDFKGNACGIGEAIIEQLDPDLRPESEKRKGSKYFGMFLDN